MANTYQGGGNCQAQLLFKEVALGANSQSSITWIHFANILISEKVANQLPQLQENSFNILRRGQDMKDWPGLEASLHQRTVFSSFSSIIAPLISLWTLFLSLILPLCKVLIPKMCVSMGASCGMHTCTIRRLRVLHVKCLGPKLLWISILGEVWGYLHIHNELSWGWEWSQTQNSFMVHTGLQAHSLNVILHNTSSHFVQETKFPDVEFSTVASC